MKTKQAAGPTWANPRVTFTGVGKDLTIRLDVPARAARRPASARVDRVVWRESAPALVEAPSAPAAPARGSVVDVAWSQSSVDPELMIATLRAERAAANGGFDHPHTAVGCVFCRRSAAVYR